MSLTSVFPNISAYLHKLINNNVVQKETRANDVNMSFLQLSSTLTHSGNTSCITKNFPSLFRVIQRILHIYIIKEQSWNREIRDLPLLWYDENLDGRWRWFDILSVQLFIQICLAFQQQQGNAGEQSAFQNIYNFFATLLKRNYIFFTNISEQKISQFVATADGNIRESIQKMISFMESAFINWKICIKNVEI